MALFNHATKEVTAKLVYYGPGLCGKTTNLQWIHGHLAFKAKGKLVSLSTQTDRTLFFDFLPIELGTVRGMRMRIQIYTVPGQVFYEATRRVVLKGCDAVVFVADSQAAMLDANSESLRSLRQNLLVNEIDPQIPLVIQYNKRDLPTALPVPVLNARLNPRDLAWFEAVAVSGVGVEDTLRGITTLLFQSLTRFYGEGDAAGPGNLEPAEAAPPPVDSVTVGLAHAVAPEAAGAEAPPDPDTARPVAPSPPTPLPGPPPATATPPSLAPPPIAPLPVPVTPPPVAAPRPEPAAPPAAAPPSVAPRPAPPASPLARPPVMSGDPPAAPVFAKPRPTLDGPAPAVVARPQPVVVPGPARPHAAPGGPAAPMLPPAAKVEIPKPGATTDPSVFRERKGDSDADDPRPAGEGLRGDQWVYLLEGRQRGPIDIEDLIDLVLTSMPEDTKVWHPGLEGWVRAREVREIAAEIPPPLPGSPRAGYVDEEMPDFDTVPAMLRTVLIADEDAAFRKYLAMPLAAQGFTIYEAADGAAAWQIAVQNRPWMILADISMPEVDGFEFCRRVRGHALLSRKPVLFISGSDKYKERYRALQMGADDFLSKNMPIRELLMRIQLLMTRYSDLNAPSEAQPGSSAPVTGALEGRVEVFGAPALLQICNQGRLSGTFSASSKDGAGHAATMGFREGEIVSATVGERSGPEAVYSFLAWQKGSFKFTPGDPGPGEPLAQSVEHLLLEGCRLLDEARAGEGGGAALA
jgi:CheY-like chemotaxis protein/signal recognition particle receptor subunit beta